MKLRSKEMGAMTWIALLLPLLAGTVPLGADVDEQAEDCGNEDASLLQLHAVEEGWKLSEPGLLKLCLGKASDEVNL